MFTRGRTNRNIFLVSDNIIINVWRNIVKMFCKGVLLQLLIIIEIYARSMNNDNSWVPRLTKKDLDGYSLVSRIPLTRLFKFNFYRDVSVLFYPMPEDVVEAKFTFKAHEEKMNYIGNFYKFSIFFWSALNIKFHYISCATDCRMFPPFNISIFLYLNR